MHIDTKQIISPFLKQNSINRIVNMKKGCFLLLVLLSLIYGYQGYKVVDTYVNDEIKIKTSGKLSDITEKVIPVLLETPDTGIVRHARHIRKDGNHLFMLSDNRLLHFDIHGNFINQIASDIHEENDVFIAGYVLDTNADQLFVIDSQRNIGKYDYDGNRISQSPIRHPWHTLSAMVFHNGYIWATAETLVKAEDTPDSYLIKNELFQLDTDMNILSKQTLRIADTGRERLFSGSCISELLVDEEGVYAYSPPSHTEHLLKDTLYLAERKKIPYLYPDGPSGMACIYPVRKGQRHTMSMCNRPAGKKLTFCFDHENLTAYILPEGFKDDFFGTGHTNLHPMDIYNKSYCFIKSGKDLPKNILKNMVNEEQTILFILNLNA